MAGKTKEVDNNSIVVEVAYAKSFMLCLVSWNIEEMKRD
jgi:hypothetical protein